MLSLHKQVTLLVPWLAPKHQVLVFPDGLSFELPEEQEHCIRSWVQKRAGFWPTFKVQAAVVSWAFNCGRSW